MSEKGKADHKRARALRRQREELVVALLRPKPVRRKSRAKAKAKPKARTDTGYMAKSGYMK